MDIKEVIAKILDGKSELTEDDKEMLKNFDPDGIAAAARRKAEAEVGTVKEQLNKLNSEKTEYQHNLEEVENSKLSETDKLSKRMEELNTQVTELKQAKESAEGAKLLMERGNAISGIRKAKGIEFIDGVDPGIVESAFAAQFKDVEDLEDKENIDRLVDNFIKTNKALIVDKSGYGSGSKPGSAEEKALKTAELSDDERMQQLNKLKGY